MSSATSTITSNIIQTDKEMSQLLQIIAPDNLNPPSMSSGYQGRDTIEDSPLTCQKLVPYIDILSSLSSLDEVSSFHFFLRQKSLDSSNLHKAKSSLFERHHHHHHHHHHYHHVNT